MPDEPASSFQVAALVADVFRLRELIEQSELDDELRKSTEVVHLIDPDIVELYTRPSIWAEALAPLPSLAAPHSEQHESPEAIEHLQTIEDIETDLSSPGGHATDEHILRATALLTGEYIFSPTFAQPFNVLFVAPEHLTELMGHIARIMARTRHISASASSGAYARIHHVLRGKFQLLSMGRIPAAQYLADSNTVIVEQLAKAAHSELLAKQRLDSLIRKEIISSVDNLKAFNPSVIAPPIDEISQWKHRIERAKSRNKVQPSTDALEADAVTLAQLEMVNKNWRKNRRAYVLVTRDRGLHHAYRQWQRRQSDEDHFFPLRHPKQYVPLLNVAAMGGKVIDRDVFVKLKSMIEGVASSFSFNELSTTEALNLVPQDIDRILQRMLARRAQKSGLDLLLKSIDDISKHWSASMEAIVSSKSDVIEALAEKEVEYWERLFVETAFPSILSSRLDSLEVAFERIQTSSAFLRHEMVALDAAAARLKNQVQPEQYGRRALISDFQGFTSPDLSRQHINDLVASLSISDRNQIGIVENAKREERLLVFACLALDAGAWTSARNLCRRARQVLDGIAKRSSGSTDFSREMTYFECISYRLGTTARNWKGDYNYARRQLDHLLGLQLPVFDKARALSERLALALCAIAWRLEESKGANIASAQEEALVGISCVLAIYNLPDVGNKLEDPPTIGWENLKKQIVLNTLNLGFWSRICGITNPRIDRLVGDALEEVDRKTTRAKNLFQGVHASLYPRMAMWAASEGKSKREHALLIREYVGDALRRDKVGGITFELPATDHIEFEHVLRVIGDWDRPTQ